MSARNQEIIDLRSDTVTRPTSEMRRAMAEAEVGDDVYQEDPTVKKLESLTAEILGKGAALFFPSGTMANQAAVLTHTTPGEEVILGANSHIYFYEVGGLARLSGVQARTLPERRGCPEPEDIAAAVRDENIHFPRTALLCLENTHNRAGGLAVDKDRIDDCCRVAWANNVPVHLDGARIFNAALELEINPDELVAECDSVMCCLSKGLGAPVGSMLAGSAEFIEQARKSRKLLGGGLRQVGVLAAAGLVALQERERLIEDHKLAEELAAIIASCPAENVQLGEQATNFVMLEYTGNQGAGWLRERLEESGVLSNKLHETRIRLVTHRDLTSNQITEFGRRLNSIL